MFKLPDAGDISKATVYRNNTMICNIRAAIEAVCMQARHFTTVRYAVCYVW